MSQSKDKIVKAASVMAGYTLLSRILGLARDIACAAVFGSSSVFDSFVVGFRVPNLFRRLFGEGALTGAVVPVLSETLHCEHSSHDTNDARALINSLVTLLLIVLSIITVIISSAALAGSFIFSACSLTLKLTAIMMPYMIFICLCGLLMGVLNCLGHFAVSAFSPAVFNIVLIATLLIASRPLSNNPGYAVTVLACGVLIGGVIQLAMHMYVLKKLGYALQLTTRMHCRIQEIIGLMIPSAAGLSVNQVNTLIDSILALMIGAGAASSLYYSHRLIEFPLGVMGIAVSTAVLPEMSRQSALKDFTSLKSITIYALRISMFLMLPSMIGILLLRTPLIQTLFERGRFGADATAETSFTLLFYCFGLCAFVFTKMLTQCFYSLKDMKTPLKIGVSMVFLNLTLNILLMQFLRQGGLALATSLCAWLNSILLYFFLHKKIGPLGLTKLLQSLLRIGAAAAVMTLAVIVCLKALAGTRPLVQITVLVPSGALVYALSARLFKCREMSEILHSVGVRRTF